MCNYEVLYVDKFIEANRSREVIGSVKLLSRLPATKQRRLVSGRPVLINEYSDQELAEKVSKEIINAGGTSWVQAQSPCGKSVERRCNKRRHMRTRRLGARSEVFQTDRREGLARRFNVLM